MRKIELATAMGQVHGHSLGSTGALPQGYTAGGVGVQGKSPVNNQSKMVSGGNQTSHQDLSLRMQQINHTFEQFDRNMLKMDKRHSKASKTSRKSIKDRSMSVN